MEIDIADELAHHCPKTIAWLVNPKTTGTEPIAIHLEQFFAHLDFDRFVDAIESDALTGARSHSQLRFDINAAIYALPLTPDPVFRSRYLYIDFHDFWKQHCDRGHLAGDEALLEAAACLRESYPDARIYRCHYTEFVVEIGDRPAVTARFPPGSEPRVATVDVQVASSVGRADRRILFALDQAMIEASPGGTEIRCHLG